MYRDIYSLHLRLRAGYLRMAGLAGLTVVLIASLALPFGVAAQGGGDDTPAGFDAFLVYMANGIYDPNDANYTAPDGTYFQRDIMGRSDAEIEQDRANAVEFFEQRFGIDADDNDSVMFTSFTFDPRNEYRAYVVVGRDVPPEGWVVRDGGWSVAVVNPGQRNRSSITTQIQDL